MFVLGWLFLLLPLSFLPTSKAQLPNLDSLLRVEDTVSVDSLKLKNLYVIGKVYQHKDSIVLSNAYFNKTYQMAIEKKMPLFEGLALRELGANEYGLGNYANALTWYMKSYEILDKNNFKKQKSICLQQIGKLHEVQTNYKIALDYYQKALEIEKELKDDNSLSYAYNNMGNILGLLKDYEKAVEFQMESIKIREKIPNNPNLTYSYNDLASLYTTQQQPEKALPYFEKAISLAEKYEDFGFLVFGYTNLGECYAQMKKWNLAQQQAEKGLALAKKLQSKQGIGFALAVLMQIEKELKNYEQAFAYQEAYILYKDSLFNEESLKSISKLETNFQIESQKKQNEILKKDLELKEKKEAAQKNLILFASVGLLLLGVVVVILYRNNQLKRKANHILIEKNEEINLQNEEIRIQSEMLLEANEEINKKNEDITGSIKYALRIQQALLPTEKSIIENFKDGFVLYQPKDIVSGDFYWWHSTPEWAVVVAADCTGHGVPGAFMSMIGSNLLDEIVKQQQIFEPHLILEKLHSRVFEVLKQNQTQNQDGMDAAVCTFFPKTNALHFAGAKSPLIWVGKGGLQKLKGDKMPIGGSHYPERRNFTLQSLQLEQGDMVYLHSDGFADQFGGRENRKFLSQNLYQLLSQNADLPLSQQKERLKKAFHDWKGRENQIDDVMVLGLQFV